MKNRTVLSHVHLELRCRRERTETGVCRVDICESEETVVVLHGGLRFPVFTSRDVQSLFGTRDPNFDSPFMGRGRHSHPFPLSRDFVKRGFVEKCLDRNQ